MTRLTLASAALILTASSALANFGDVEAQLDQVKMQTIAIAQPLEARAQDLASADTCTLSFTHIVSIPEEFTPAGGVQTACLDE